MQGTIGIIVALAFVSIYLQWRSNTAETEASKIFFNLVTLLSLIILMGAATIVSQAYSPQVQNVVNVGYWAVVMLFIITIVFTMAWIMFLPSIPKKYQEVLRVFG